MNVQNNTDGKDLEHCFIASCIHVLSVVSLAGVKLKC